MFSSILVLWGLSTLIGNADCNTVTSPQIRILDVATKASETRLMPQRIEYKNSFHPYFDRFRYDPSPTPLKSYVIYDDYPFRIFREWKANASPEFSEPAPYFHVKAEFAPDFYHRNGHRIPPLSPPPPPPKPTLAYQSVYSNVIKVFDNSLEDFDRNRFQSEKYTKVPQDERWKPPVNYEPLYPEEDVRRRPYQNQKLPENFPNVFFPNDKFHYPSFHEEIPKPPQFLHPPEGFYEAHTVNYDQGNEKHKDEVEVLPEAPVTQKNLRRTYLCSFIRLNQKQFPDDGGPCGRSGDDSPLLPPEYPDYSNLPNDKIPVEHRRQHHQMKRIRRSLAGGKREKRTAGFGYISSSWGSPFGYDNGYDGYFNDYSRSRGGFGNDFGYVRNRNRNQGYRNRYYGGSRSNYEDYEDEYQNGDDNNSRGLTSYLTNGGRRYKNRKNNNNDDDDDDEDDDGGDGDNNNNRDDDDSDEEMERQHRRGQNDRRNNENSRDRRRNNSSNNNNNNNNNNDNNDDDDYRENRRNNNRQNNNSRRNNNKKYNNDRYNSNRNRYSGNSNGYGNNNGYGYGSGSGYGNGNSNSNSYGNSYGNGYGSSSSGYGNGYGGNNGYGNNGGYGYSGGYGGYGGYGSGNGFGSF